MMDGYMGAVQQGHFRMDLLTPEQREKLLENGRNPDIDHWPVVKLFNPAGYVTWLVAAMRPDEDTLDVLEEALWIEETTASFKEIRNFRNILGQGIERDPQFKPAYPMSVYARAAKSTGRIDRCNDAVLKKIAELLDWERETRRFMTRPEPDGTIIRTGADLEAEALTLDPAERGEHHRIAMYWRTSKRVQALIEPLDNGGRQFILDWLQEWRDGGWM